MISASLGPLAQLVEQEAFNLCVVGSNPTRPTSFCSRRCSSIVLRITLEGPLAQLVEQEAFNLCVVGSNPTRPTILVIVSIVPTKIKYSKKHIKSLPHCARSSAG